MEREAVAGNGKQWEGLGTSLLKPASRCSSVETSETLRAWRDQEDVVNHGVVVLGREGKGDVTDFCNSLGLFWSNAKAGVFIGGVQGRDER